MGASLDGRCAFLIVQRVDLVRADQLRLRGQLRSEQLQFLPDDVHVRDRIAPRHARDVDEMNEHLRPFEMPEELVSQSLPAMRAFDQAGDVRDDKAAFVAQADDAEVRDECGEWVIGDLRTRRGDARDQRRLAGIGKADQAHIGQQLQLEAEELLLAGFSRLDLAGRAVGRRREMGVADAATAALCHQDAVARVCEVRNQREARSRERRCGRRRRCRPGPRA